MGILSFLSRFFEQRFVFVGVPVIIKNSRGEILLGKRNSKSVSFPRFWGLPGGLVDHGEPLRSAVVREVKEELGVEVKVLKRAKNIYETFPGKNSKFHSLGVPFYAKIISGVPKAKNETSDVKWFKPSQIRKMELAYNHKEILKSEGVI